ncbi:MAG: fumarylacetoacetate hydrolase family protein [Anaerolineae bacterium]
MRLVTYSPDHAEPRLGAVRGDQIVDLVAADPSLPTSLLDLLQAGEAAVARAQGVAAEATASQPLAAARLAAPIGRPSKVLAIGRNYKAHAAETGSDLPTSPIVFPKFTTAIIGPGAPITWDPSVINQIDYEGELCVVIGKTAKAVQRANALDYVAGYMCGNDVSARDLQFANGGQWGLGKSPDTFCPLGPWLVTKDEIPNPNALGIRTLLNGQVMQESNTENMIFDVATIIAFITRTMTLLPGDVIMTGTPDGVGMARTPQVWLKPGDRIVIEIDGIGRLENPVH